MLYPRLDPAYPAQGSGRSEWSIEVFIPAYTSRATSVNHTAVVFMISIICYQTFSVPFFWVPAGLSPPFPLGNGPIIRRMMGPTKLTEMLGFSVLARKWR
ncbi:uncharacterized protein MYCFIDRAFT_175324 [Pseudocercospora fijiensis CIRAD86]|uniref:Uncharacterized protein n=1 Tax=Pseudocercospora fijiensis (strain CIRAD86) TaxID=383855 RepID=M3AB08_PSEFD|nr:uncharacterized protein MYCFIDRAFT_175324 [Pseudocercospora fijiensis CIRAD86]EME81746.1 hypothetical protein MYCFIDRAFT_175324 [Pseudocercospora fijiensis CIRAD86]